MRERAAQAAMPLLRCYAIADYDAMMFRRRHCRRRRHFRR